MIVAPKIDNATGPVVVKSSWAMTQPRRAKSGERMNPDGQSYTGGNARLVELIAVIVEKAGGDLHMKDHNFQV